MSRDADEGISSVRLRCADHIRLRASRLLFDSKLLQLGIEELTIDPEQPSCLGLIALGASKGPLNEFPLKHLHRFNKRSAQQIDGTERRGAALTLSRGNRKVSCGNQRAASQDDRVLNDVLQLSDVSWIVVSEK